MGKKIGIENYSSKATITIMKRDLNRIAGKAFDLAILGGGITGAGVAMDAALRGLDVVLIEKNDFGSGTSGLSSKLVHGGLRYLEQGALSLVFEALHERGLLLQNAPHLVSKLPFLLPVHPQGRVPLWKWRLGLKLYDILSIGSNSTKGRTLSPQQWKGLPLRWKVPPSACLEYMDASMDDARLCLGVIQTAAQNGAQVANHLEVTGLDLFPGRMSRIAAKDLLTGERVEIESRLILNATGPWCDKVRALAGEDAIGIVRPTKGVHIVLPPWGMEKAMLLLHPEDGRVFFVIPWLGRTLVGTTDTVWEGSPDELCVTEEEVDYLLRGVRHYLKVEPGLDEVLQKFAGLRPLISSTSKPSERSREFALQTGKSGLISVSGGKYTTFRSMARKITDQICKRLGNKARCQTKHHPIFGAYKIPRNYFLESGQMELKYQYGIEGDAAIHLLGRYGTKAGLVAKYVSDLGPNPERVVPVLPDLLGEFLYHKEQEMAILDRDYLYQRTRIGLLARSYEVQEAGQRLHALLGLAV